MPRLPCTSICEQFVHSITAAEWYLLGILFALASIGGVRKHSAYNSALEWGDQPPHMFGRHTDFFRLGLLWIWIFIKGAENAMDLQWDTLRILYNMLKINTKFPNLRRSPIITWKPHNSQYTRTIRVLQKIKYNTFFLTLESLLNYIDLYLISNAFLTFKKIPMRIPTFICHTKCDLVVISHLVYSISNCEKTLPFHCVENWENTAWGSRRPQTRGKHIVREERLRSGAKMEFGGSSSTKIRTKWWVEIQKRLILLRWGFSI